MTLDIIILQAQGKCSSKEESREVKKSVNGGR
jgi:hypothetical protein